MCERETIELGIHPTALSLGCYGLLSWNSRLR